MYNHAPESYDCPFCRVAKNEYTETYPLTRPGDVFLKTEWATAFIAAGTWPNNPGNVLVIPNRHFENIYELPLEYATEVPEVRTVFEYHGLFGQTHLQTIAAECRSGARGCVACKRELAARADTFLEPIRRRRAELEGNQKEVLELLLEGTRKAREVARKTLARVKRNMHLNYLEEVA